MCRPGMSPKDKTYKSIRNQNKIRLEGDVNSCSPGSSFKREPIGQWQLQGLKRELTGQRLSRPLRASHFHPLTLCTCNGCQHSYSLNKYPSTCKPTASECQGRVKCMKSCVPLFRTVDRLITH